MKRPIVTIHLPLEMGAVGRILLAVAHEYPDATLGNGTHGEIVVDADPDAATYPSNNDVDYDAALSRWNDLR